MVNNSAEINLVNNFVQTTGVGPVTGINVQNSTSCRAFYNSVNITNNDAQAKSKGFRLKAGSDLVARNNIFNIKNEGTPFYIDPGIISFLPDYNNYYHPDGMIGVVNGQVFYNLFTWGQTINGDANSKAINPFFKADTLPLPYQRALNGAGIPLPGIVNDVYGVIRNPQAPDIGCMEFLVDYGIIELISPSLDCYHPVIDSVTVYLKQFGHLPFDDLKIAYQLDNGPIETDTIPGPLENDLIHTFGTAVNITAFGDYFFKVWLIGNLDDNINNDTLKAMRYSKPPPVATFDYDNFCTGKKVSFFGQAAVAEPYYIDHYEWLFGDGGTSPDQNPVHTFPGPGTYDVTLRAYSNAGCYGDTTKQVFIDPNFPALEFQYNIVNETCLGDSTGSIEIIVSGGYPPYNLFVNGAAITDDSLFNLTSGQYEIRVEDSQNCSLTDTVEIFPSIMMNPQIQANPLSGNAPLTVEFDFTADNVWRWTWYFSDVDVDTNKATSFTFEEYGYHEVILQMQSGPPYYCVELATIQIFVDISVSISANSVFTPNGDGYNDFFEIKTTGIKEMDVNIFNQWGNKVYKITEVNGKWDGDTDEGAKAPDGTYFYAMKAIGYNDLTYDRQGSVLLLRHAAEVFPNPVSDNVNLKIYDQLQPPVCVSVYSVFGQLVQTESIADPQKIIIDVSHLKGGIYVLKANDGNRTYFIRFIKN
jgi:gliding motility-associated-like protein